MGWDFITGIDRDELVRRLTTVEVAPDWTCQAHQLAHEQGGVILWAVWANPDTKRQMIVCHLLQPGHGGWGHKDLAESSGPYFYSCPERFLDLAPEANPAWRERVRQYHQLAQGFDRVEAMLAVTRDRGIHR